jgi:hypothetical protein
MGLQKKAAPNPMLHRITNTAAGVQRFDAL